MERIGYIVLIFLMLAWAVVIVVQSKISSAVKRSYRELGSGGEIYYGKALSVNPFAPQAVVVVLCSLEGGILDCRKVYHTGLRDRPAPVKWEALTGQAVSALSPEVLSSDDVLRKALYSLKKNYQTFSAKFH